MFFCSFVFLFCFFFNETATTEIYTYLHTLSLHDALPIYGIHLEAERELWEENFPDLPLDAAYNWSPKEWTSTPSYNLKDWTGDVTREEVDLIRSEEHTSELQSLMRISYAVFCLKKKTNHYTQDYILI